MTLLELASPIKHCILNMHHMINMYNKIMVCPVLFFFKKKKKKKPFGMHSDPKFGWRVGDVKLYQCLGKKKKVPECCSGLHCSEKELLEQHSSALSQKYHWVCQRVVS
jgi:hypothetical protein